MTPDVLIWPFRMTFPDDKCIRERCAVWRSDWVSCHMGCQPGHCVHHGDEAGFDQGYCGLRGN